MFLAIGPVAGTAGMAGMAGMSDMGGMQMLKYPTLAFAFTLILVGYTIWDLDQLSGKRYSLTSTRMSPARIPTTAVPAMAGAEPAAPGFSGLSSEDIAVGAVGPVTAADGQTPPADLAAASPDAIADGPGAVGTTAVGGRVGQFLLSPAVTVSARIVMGVAMAFMLLILI